ncbi:MAG: hypothetical protein Q9M37_03500 [Desulfonauticus sp.]|nr:hypothetical protein [Desulfonauticus sp.]
MYEDVRKYIENEFRSVFGIEPTEDVVERLIEEYKRVVKEFEEQGFTTEEAKILAKGVIREAIKRAKHIT